MPDQKFGSVRVARRIGNRLNSDPCVTLRVPNHLKLSASLAEMRQPLVRMEIRPEIAKWLREAAESKWPGQGQRAVDRLAREMIRRNLRNSNG